MPQLRIVGTVLSTRDADALASFYERLLGWPRLVDEDEWVVLGESPHGPGLCFHKDVEYVPPVWPSAPNSQLMMMHIDIATDDMQGAVAHAMSCGARHAPEVDQEDEISVMLDPDGHPFCLLPEPNW